MLKEIFKSTVNLSFAGDRIFPPQTGLSYSTWICVERFSDPRSDPHCVRLLTLVRNLHSARDDHLICLAVLLSARDKAIIITTQETPLSHSKSNTHNTTINNIEHCKKCYQENQING